MGAFHDVSVPPSLSDTLTWTNSASLGTINRASGVTVNWTGGANGTYAQISGNVVATAFSASFVCNAPVGAGAFTVPPAILLTLPAGIGELTVRNYATPSAFTVSELDIAFSTVCTLSTISPMYQ